MLAVRQTGIFTAVIQPPLILFVAVPTAYFLFHGGQITGIKDTLINFGYPLIERFPLMFFTSAAVLLIGIARWYYGMSTRRAAPAVHGNGIDKHQPHVEDVVAVDAGARRGRDADAAEPPRRKHTIERPGRATKATAADTTRTGRPAKRATPSRSRHARPPDTEIIEPVAERPRRPRSTRQTEQPPSLPPNHGVGRARRRRATQSGAPAGRPPRRVRAHRASPPLRR